MPAADRPSPLSVQRAFVVQFRLETDLAQGRCAGRVEHVASGQAMLFDTLEELTAFITCVLAQVPRQPME
ncbi:MAG: hypothetical protein OEU26_17105 [Candidatus Tectomicrobia bacterium]|nr:hypothetical protein [Candidatus Tectomicrobia bacterium]